jgi:hypothetical protein
MNNTPYNMIWASSTSVGADVAGLKTSQPIKKRQTTLQAQTLPTQVENGPPPIATIAY